MNSNYKPTTLDVDSFQAYANIIKSEHKQMLEARKSYIKAMYKILRDSNYTREVAIDQIYNILCDKLNSMIEVRKTWIEDITKEVN